MNCGIENTIQGASDPPLGEHRFSASAIGVQRPQKPILSKNVFGAEVSMGLAQSLAVLSENEDVAAGLPMGDFGGRGSH